MTKFKPIIGQTVKINSLKGKFEGTIISASKDFFTLKLFTGYNIILSEKEITELIVEKQKKQPTTIQTPSTEFNHSLPVISILQLGGTISSKVDYATGAVKADFQTGHLVSMFPEISKIANFKSKLVARMLSEDMRFAHYEKLALEIKKEIQTGGIKGIIVTHGTDTMHYTSAALSFVFENLSLPVIFVGAQRSTDRGSSDAILNLLSAVQFIAKTDFKGIAICMHESTEDKNCLILPALKTRKLHTSRRDAFKPVNALPIARINPHADTIEFFSKQQIQQTQKPLVFKNKFEQKVALIKIHPNMSWQQIDFFRKQKFKGLIIEGTGLGHAPISVPDKLSLENKKIFDAIKKLAKSGCIIGMTSQCLYGSVQMHVYENGVLLQEIGVIPCQDMLPETAFVKLAWLLANEQKKEIPQLMQKNLRQEINERTQMDFFPPKNL